MKLKELQSQFLADVLQQSENPHIELIETDERLRPEQRIEIYSDGYQLRLIEALMDTYPAVHTLLGDEDFDSLSREYISTHPSRHFSLRYFGSELFKFIKNHPEYNEFAFLFEMSEFEWNLRNAFDALDAPVLTRDELIAIDPDSWANLKFKIHPSFSSLVFEWNTPLLWKAIIQDAPPQPPEKLNSSQQWIIWRPALETQFRSIDSLEALILDQIQQEKTFSDICEFIALETGAGAEQVAINHLGRWVDEGLLLSLSSK